MFIFSVSGRVNGSEHSHQQRVHHSSSPSRSRREDRSRSRSPNDDDHRFKARHFSRRSPDSRSNSPSREEVYNAARFAAEHALKMAGAERAERARQGSSHSSPHRDRSVSPLRRTPTSTATSEKMSNGFGSMQNGPGSNPGIASALQNMLQAGQSSSMQQVICSYFRSFFYYLCFSVL